MKVYKLEEITLGIFDGKHGGCKQTENTGYYFISVKDLTEYDIDYTNAKQISKDEFDEIYSRTSLENGDVAYANTGDTIGKCVFIKDNAYTASTSFQKSIAVLKPNCDLVIDRYLYYLMKFETPRLREAATGSAQKNLLLSTMRSFTVNIHQIETQKKIVAVLGAIDDKIMNNQKINRNLLDQGRTLYEDFISGYEVNAKLRDLINSIETGSRPRGGAQESGVPSIGAEKIECFGVYDYLGEKFISEEFFKKLKKGHVLSGDVLLYKDGAYTGKSSMALDDFPHVKCAINEHVFKLNTSDNLYQFFLYFTLDNKKNKDYIYTLASSKAAQPGLNQTELLSVDIILPDKTALIEFEGSVSQMMHLIASNAKENRRLAMLRDLLLQKLMCGELDVSELEL